jgi:DNA-binding HxlR family transcriptional regulator
MTRPRSAHVAHADCPAPLAFAILGGKWKLGILQILIFEGTQRFGSLKRAITGITQTMLTSQLRALEEDGLVRRKVFAEVPPRVEYSATPDAMALVPMFTSMHDWWKKRESSASRRDFRKSR